MPPELILASRSPRRCELLRTLGVEFTVDAADIDETPRTRESPENLVRRLASAKAEAVANRHSGDAVILGADTIVVSGDRILGKPVNLDDAREMLLNLAGTWHRVLSGVACKRAGRTAVRVSVSEVLMAHWPSWAVDAYCASGEPLDKAGAYAIQGQAGAFVRCLRGSFSEHRI